MVTPLFGFSGAITILQAPEDGHTFEFTYLELYGGAQLAVNGTGAGVVAKRIYGDDSAQIHIAPGQTLDITEVRFNPFSGLYIIVCKAIIIIYLHFQSKPLMNFLEFCNRSLSHE